MPRKNSPPTPLDLLFMLIDSCMHRLSPNAWKVVCYVAAQHLRVHPEWLDRISDPGVFFLQRDLERGAGIISPSGESGERPYRQVEGGPAVPGWEGPGRYALISLKEFCHGMRSTRRRGWRDYGTGLSKSSAAKAINDAIRSGILVRCRNQSAGGRDLASLYAIDWDKVQEFDWRRRKGLSARETRPNGVQ